MNLYFLRHAKAYARSEKWEPDSQRPLTPEGEEKMWEVARGMKQLELSCDIILTSPYVRALRTAEIAAEVLKAKKKLKITANLEAVAGLNLIVEEIGEKYSALENIVLVGHEPFMTQLMSVLLTGEMGLAVDFKKAGLGKLSIEKLSFGKCACLEWLLTPGQLAELG